MSIGSIKKTNLQLFTNILIYTLAAVHGLRLEEISPTKAMATSTIFPHTITPSLSSVLPTSSPTKEDPCTEGEGRCASLHSPLVNLLKWEVECHIGVFVPKE